MSRLVNLLIAATAASGLYILLSDSWNLPYRWNLIVHPLLGVAATGLLVFYAASHIKDKLKGEGRVSAGRIALLVALPAIGVLLGHVAGRLRWAPLIVVGALLVGPLKRVGRFVMKRLRHAPAVLLGGAALALWIAALTTGIPMLALEGLPVTHGEIYSHRSFAIAAAAVYAVHLLFIRVYRAERSVTPETEKAKADLRAALRIGGGVTALLVVALVGERALPGPSYTAELFRLPRDGHPAPLDPPFSGNDVRALEVESSCATSGCHASIVDDYQHSTHRTSPRTPYFQRTVELLAEERGEHDALVCAGCHYPQAMITPERDFRAYGAGAYGFTCMSCHGIADVAFDTSEHRKSSITFEPPMDHLRMFVDAKGDERIGGLDLQLIRMNPLGHGRAMTPGPQHEQELCLACHHNEITPADTGSFEFPECRACHMQPPSMLGRPGTERSHVFPGANTAVPFALGAEESLAITRGFLANDFELYIEKWGSAWVLRAPGHGSEEHRALYLRMVAKIDGEPHPGEPLELQVSTTNVIEHPFPGGPFDLIEVWLYAKVTDADGRVLLESGALDERQRVDANAQFLGGHVLGADGLPLRQHRIWEDNEEIPDRRISPGATETLTYPFVVPESGLALPLHIEARWNYRKLNPEFTEWAYGREGVVMPTTVVESLESEWRPPRTRAKPDGVE